MDVQPHRILVSHAAPEAYAPMTRAILAKLGYAILMPEEFDSLAEDAQLEHPALRIVDERNLAEVPEEADPVPIIVISGRHGVTGADSRIVGALKRPAGMHELFRLIQQVTEDTPRSTLRVPTHLPARCHKSGRAWSAAVLSLSENGCLVRSPEPLNLGSRVDVEFTLPGHGALRLDGETAYQLLPDLGLIFHATPARDREAIARFVAAALGV
jgi:hypothetical protein